MLETLVSGWIVELSLPLLVPNVVPEQWQVPRRAQHMSCQDRANPGVMKPAKKGQHFRMKWCHCCASCSKCDAAYNVPFAENAPYSQIAILMDSVLSQGCEKEQHLKPALQAECLLALSSGTGGKGGVVPHGTMHPTGTSSIPPETALG